MSEKLKECLYFLPVLDAYDYNTEKLYMSLYEIFFALSWTEDFPWWLQKQPDNQYAMERVTRTRKVWQENFKKIRKSIMFLTGKENDPVHNLFPKPD